MAENRLSITAALNTEKFQTGLAKMQRGLSDLSRKSEAVGRNLTRNLTAPLGVAGGAAIKFAADLESLTTSFVSLTGGADQAAAAVERLVDFTAKTPFQLEQVAAAARQLIAAGIQVDQVSDSLQFLGDIAATTGQPINEIAAIFAKVRAKGKVELENLNQLAERGIPIFTALSEATGLLPSELGAGAVSVEQLETVLRSFSAEGGFANGAMERLSATANGKLSTALDNVKIALASLGDEFLPAIKGILDGVTNAAQAFTSLDSETKRTIISIGLFAAGLGPAILLTSKLASGISGVIGAFRTLSTMLSGTAVSAAALAGPLALVGAAVASVVTFFAVQQINKYNKEMQLLEERAQRLADSDFEGSDENTKKNQVRLQKLKEINKVLQAQDGEFINLRAAQAKLTDDAEEYLFAIARQLKSELGRAATREEIIERVSALELRRQQEIYDDYLNKQSEIDAANRESARLKKKEEENVQRVIEQNHQDNLANIREEAAAQRAADDERVRNASSRQGLDLAVGFLGSEDDKRSALIDSLEEEQRIRRENFAQAEKSLRAADLQLTKEERSRDRVAEQLRIAEEQLEAASRAETLASTATEDERKAARAEKLRLKQGVADLKTRLAERERAVEREAATVVEATTRKVDAENKYGDAIDATRAAFVEDLVRDSEDLRVSSLFDFDATEVLDEVDRLDTAARALREKLSEDADILPEPVKQIINNQIQLLDNAADRLLDVFKTAQDQLVNETKDLLGDVNEEVARGQLSPEAADQKKLGILAKQYEKLIQLREDLMKRGFFGAAEDVQVPATFAEFVGLAGSSLDVLTTKVEEAKNPFFELANGITNFFNSLISDVASGTASLTSIITAALRKILIQVGALIAAYTVLNILSGGAFAASGGGPGLGAFIQSGLGIPKFAEGGAVLGSTLALIGEKPGSRGEAVVPFEKIGQFVNMVGGGEASGNVTVTGRLRGGDIYLSGQSGDNKRNRLY